MSSTKLPIPRSADLKYKSLKCLGNGKDGHVVLAVPRSGDQDLSSCVVLKILKGDSTTSVARKMLGKLKGMERDEDHLIATVRNQQETIRDQQIIEHPKWHCMSYIPGCSIEQLLDAVYGDDGMPPTVVFHVLAELIRVQRHLKANGLTHADLAAGGNFMLGNNGNDPWPSVTLVDFGGISDYNENKQIQHIFKLIVKMTRHHRAIPECWKLPSFQDEDLETAEKVITTCDRQKLSPDEEQSRALWNLWSVDAIRLKHDFRDDAALADLRNALENSKITDQDVARMATIPEVKMEVLKFDAACMDKQVDEEQIG
ncbi:hypothetical protein J4E91_000954 [Alternaria rosae]|nr:hypothetical protein J4E91_000954 [Alternaria rosae]